MKQPRIMANAKELAALSTTYSKGLDVAFYDIDELEVRSFDGIDHVRGTVFGSGSKVYRTGADIDVAACQIKRAWCTCPASKNYYGLCKHEIGLVGRYLAAEGIESVYRLNAYQVGKGPFPEHVASDEKAKTLPPMPANAHEFTNKDYRPVVSAAAGRAHASGIGAGAASTSGAGATSTSSAGAASRTGATPEAIAKSGPSAKASSGTKISPAESARSSKQKKSAPKKSRQKPKPPEAATDGLVLNLIAGMAGDRIAAADAAGQVSAPKDGEATPELAHVELTFMPARDPYAYSTLGRGIANVWTIKLRVSRGKASYQVKRLDELVRAWETGAVVTYGKNLSFAHGPAAFDERSNALLEAVSRIIFAQEAAFVAKERAWGGKSITNANAVNVSGEDLADLLNTQQGGSVTYDPDLPAYAYGAYGKGGHGSFGTYGSGSYGSGRYGSGSRATIGAGSSPDGSDDAIVLPKKATLPVREGDPELTVRVAVGQNGGYDLTVTGASAAVFGKDCLYLVADGAVTKCSSEFLRRMGRFCQMMLPCYKPYHVRETDMQSFTGTVLPSLEGMAKLDLAPGVEDMVPPPPEFSFRIALEGGIVSCIASVSYGERTLSLFERAREGQPPRDIARETEARRAVRSLFAYGEAPVPDYTSPAIAETDEADSLALSGYAGTSAYSYVQSYLASRGYVAGTTLGRYGAFRSWEGACAYLGLPQSMREPSGPWFPEDDVDALYQLLDEGLAELSDLGEVYVSRNLARVEIRDVPDVHVNASVSGGLLDLDVDIEGLSAADIMAYLSSYRQHRRYVRLSNGDIMRLGEGLGAVSDLADGLGIPVERLAEGVDDLPANRTLFVDALLKRAGGVRLSRDAGFRHIVRDFDTIADADFDEPASLRRVLRPYQAEGFKWLSTLSRTSFGGILADDMGLGKTLQVLCFLLARREGCKGQTTEGMFEVPAAADAGASSNGSSKTAQPGSASESAQGSAGLAVSADDSASRVADADDARSAARPAPALVVCPASLVYNWMDEIARFTPELDAVAVLGTKSERRNLIEDAPNHDLLVTSYDLMKRDIGEYELQHLGVVVLDEAQYIKTPSTQVAKCAKRLVADQRFACTGTPVENNLGELWSIFDFLMPGILGSRESFRKRFERPIAAGDEAAAHRLQCLVSPFILRRLKGDVLKDLPEKNESVVYATMEGEQAKLYKANAARIALTLSHQMPEEFAANKIAILAELTRLRQICCDPHLAYDNYKGGSAKLDTCLELVRNAIDGGHQVLLFSQFTSMLDIIAARLGKERIGYLMLTGATSKKERAALVAQFQAGKAPVFLISLKAGGVGLNLTAADVVIHYDPWWNLAAQNQATDRAHRIGQKRAVSVFKLIAKGTIEEKIVEMQDAKHDLAESVLGGEAAGSTKLTRDDVLALLDASAEG